MGIFDQKTDNPEAILALAGARLRMEVAREEQREAAEMAMGDAETLKVVDHPRKYAFLVAYAKAGNVTDACRASGISRATHYVWMKEDNYPDAFKLAKEIFSDSIAREAYSRAVEGWEEPVYQAGQLVGTVIRKSDRLLEVLLKGSDPDTYQRKSVDVSGSIQHNHTGEVQYQVQAWHLELKGQDAVAELRRQMQNNKLNLKTEPREMKLLPAQGEGNTE